MATTLLVETFHPFSSLTLTLPSDTPLSEITSHLPLHLQLKELELSLPAGLLVLDDAPLSSLWDPRSDEVNEACDDGVQELTGHLVSMRLAPRILGGKGGFGSQLRAAGGRMSSQKTSNNDSCRDLNGRRLSTIKEAKALAAYLEAEPERQKAKQEAQRAKLEKLERKLGIDGKDQGTAEGAGSSSASSSKRRFGDTEYLEQSRDIVDNVKSAVTAGLLKKRKKAKQSPPPQGDGADAVSSSVSVALGSASKAVELTSSKVGASEQALPEDGNAAASGIIEKVSESAATTPITTAASASLAAVGA